MKTALFIPIILLCAVSSVPAGAAVDQKEVVQSTDTSMTVRILSGREHLNPDTVNDPIFKSARVLYNERKYAESLSAYDAFLQNSTDSVQTSQALYESGKALWRNQYYDEAIIRFRRVIKEYPGSPVCIQAYFEIGRTQFGLSRYREAIATYQSVVTNYKDTPEVKEAEFQIIQCYYLQRDFQGTSEKLMVFKKKYPTDERIKKVEDFLERENKKPSSKKD